MVSLDCPVQKSIQNSGNNTALLFGESSEHLVIFPLAADSHHLRRKPDLLKAQLGKNPLGPFVSRHNIGLDPVELRATECKVANLSDELGGYAFTNIL